VFYVAEFLACHRHEVVLSLEVERQELLEPICQSFDAQEFARIQGDLCLPFVGSGTSLGGEGLDELRAPGAEAPERQIGVTLGQHF
jgi:hypothetical protein